MHLGQIVYCRHAGCGVGYAYGGELPTVCPRCDQPAKWTTVPPWVLTAMDRRFLTSLRISAAGDADDRLGAREGEDDGA